MTEYYSNYFLYAVSVVTSISPYNEYLIFVK